MEEDEYYFFYLLRWRFPWAIHSGLLGAVALVRHADTRCSCGQSILHVCICIHERSIHKRQKFENLSS